MRKSKDGRDFSEAKSAEYKQITRYAICYPPGIIPPWFMKRIQHLPFRLVKLVDTIFACFGMGTPAFSPVSFSTGPCGGPVCELSLSVSAVDTAQPSLTGIRSPPAANWPTAESTS